MPAYYEFRSVEMDRVGCGKRKCAPVTTFSNRLFHLRMEGITFINEFVLFYFYSLGCWNLLVADRATFSVLPTANQQQAPSLTTLIILDPARDLAVIWAIWAWKPRLSIPMTALLLRLRLPRPTDRPTIPNPTPRDQVNKNKSPNKNRRILLSAFPLLQFFASTN